MKIYLLLITLLIPNKILPHSDSPNAKSLHALQQAVKVPNDILETYKKDHGERLMKWLSQDPQHNKNAFVESGDTLLMWLIDQTSPLVVDLLALNPDARITIPNSGDALTKLLYRWDYGSFQRISKPRLLSKIMVLMYEQGDSLADIKEKLDTHHKHPPHFNIERHHDTTSIAYQALARLQKDLAAAQALPAALDQEIPPQLTEISQDYASDLAPIDRTRIKKNQSLKRKNDLDAARIKT